MTVIFTTQLLSGVDVSFFRYTNISPIVRYVDRDVIKHERPEWKELILEGQYQLSRVSSANRYLDYFYSAKDQVLVKTIFPEWLDKKHDPIKADLLSRPMRYHSFEDKERMIKGNAGVKKSAKKDKSKENMTE